AGVLAAAAFAVWSQRERIERLAIAATDLPGARPATRAASRSTQPAETTTTPSTGAIAPSTPSPNAPADRAAATPAAPAAPLPPPNAAVARFDSLADSLEQATRNFHDRSADFAVGRLTCNGIALGY